MSLKIFSKWFNPPFRANARHFFMPGLLSFLGPLCEAKLGSSVNTKTSAGSEAMKMYALKQTSMHCCNLIAELSGATGGG